MSALALSGRPPIALGPRRVIHLVATLAAAVTTLAVTALTGGVPLGHAAMTSTRAAGYSYDSPARFVQLECSGARRFLAPLPIVGADSQAAPRSNVLLKAVGVAAEEGSVDLTTPAARSSHSGRGDTAERNVCGWAPAWDGIPWQERVPERMV